MPPTRIAPKSKNNSVLPSNLSGLAHVVRQRRMPGFSLSLAIYSDFRQSALICCSSLSIAFIARRIARVRLGAVPILVPRFVFTAHFQPLGATV